MNQEKKDLNKTEGAKGLPGMGRGGHRADPSTSLPMGSHDSKFTPGSLEIDDDRYNNPNVNVSIAFH